MEILKIYPDGQSLVENYKVNLADVLIKRASGVLYLQRHIDPARKSFGAVNLFGGHVEIGESITQAALREIAEETGAQIDPRALIYIAALTEDFTQHTELVHVHFWHDQEDTITGCYERGYIEFNTAQDALQYPHLMPYTRWAIEECVKKGLI